MSQEHLATYLNDHLAGAVLALELLEHLEKTHADDNLEEFFTVLRADVAKDRDELEGFMKELKIDQSRTRKAAAWVSEKLTELKLRFDDPKAGDLLLFESLEALSLGIEGKHSLWTALEAVAKDESALQLPDFDRLKRRAHEQRGRVEDLRVRTAKAALRPGS